MREWSCVLYSHQRCWGLQGLPGQVTAKGTWQHYVGLGEASHPKGGQKSGWLPLRLPGCNVHHPNDAQECPGNFLPYFIREDTSITPFHSIAKGLPSGGTAGFSCPPASVPKWSPQPKRWCPSPDPVDSMPLGGTTSKVTPGGPPAPSGKNPALQQST